MIFTGMGSSASRRIWCSLAVAVFLLGARSIPAQTSDKFLFLVVPFEETHNFRDEAFVIELDREQKAVVDALKARGKFAQFSSRIAAGAVDYNKNYLRPDRAVWNWRVVAVENVQEAGAFPAVEDPRYDAHPEDIAASPEEWIRQNGDRYTPRRYRVGAEFNPASTEKFYYWLAARRALRSSDTFVVEVDDVTRARIEELFWMGHEVGVSGQIAAGAAPYNKNYNAPGQPIWNWHFQAVTGLRDFTIFAIDSFEINPNRDSTPSEIATNPAEWIGRYGASYRPKDFAIVRRVDPASKVAVVNVSNRGMTGAGEKALITGLIIKGGEPRNVIVRALGPSLTAAGVQQVATNPKIEVFSASGRRIAANGDWKADARASAMSEAFPALAPRDDKEAALWLTLMPGSYTMHGTNEDGTEGVVLLEAYDIDSNNE